METVSTVTFFTTEGEAIVAAIRGNRNVNRAGDQQFVVLEGPEENWAIMTREEAMLGGFAWGEYSAKYVGPDDY